MVYSMGVKGRQLHYHHDCVQELKQLYIDLAPPEEQEGRCWDLSVDDLKDDILLLDDDNERKESFLHQLNITVSKMSFIPQKPVHKQLYKAGYQLLVEAVEKIVTQSVLVRQVMALPEKDFDEFIDDSSDGKGKKGGARATQEKKAPPTAKGDNKGAKVSKEPTKGEIKSGKTSATPSLSRGPPSRGKTGGSLGDRERTASPPGFLTTSMVSEDPVIDHKYKEKIFAQAYSIVGDCMDNMECVFEEILNNDDERPTLRP